MGAGVEERTLLDLCVWLSGARGCVWDCAPSPPGSWLGLCMEEVAGHGFFDSLIPERVAEVVGAGGPHPRVLGAAWWSRVLAGKALGL